MRENSESSIRTYSHRLAHHGAAASSNRQVLSWIPPSPSSRASTRSDSNSNSSSSCLVYASHSILNLAERQSVRLANGTIQDNVWNVQQTLRTRVVERAILSRTNPHEALPVITALATIIMKPSAVENGTATPQLACGFSNGAINVWIKTTTTTSTTNETNRLWKEHVVVEPSSTDDKKRHRSISAISGISYWLENNEMLLIMTGSSAGAMLYYYNTTLEKVVLTQCLTETPACAVTCQAMALPSSSSSSSSTILAFVGTASPRHNKIHVYHLEIPSSTTKTAEKPHQALISHYAGGLTGHEDWISCFDWKQLLPSPIAGTTTTTASSYMLASGSQDAKIRLWRFHTTYQKDITPMNATDQSTNDTEILEDDCEDDELDDAHNDQGEEEDQEGESRLEIILQQFDSTRRHVTSVTLEALLMGHEESVTSISWHPNPAPTYGVPNVLISSSMDRTILLWAPTEGGVWTPIARVGSAGGILGGSIGSTLLGYCRATIDPASGRHLVGHAYGGSLHVWTLDDKTQHAPVPLAEDPANDDGTLDVSGMAVEERAALVQWRATPCITGHYRGVTDLCWEASAGQYLLTVSNDQTCRLWAPISLADNESSNDKQSIWMELGRPQVHGYDINAVASVSTAKHPHLLVTGADEKELRVFDAPKSTLGMLQGACNGGSSVADTVHRVERAFIPSLGLSNKASETDAAEEAEVGGSGNPLSGNVSAHTVCLPVERDLGVASLWPEVCKLFGHNAELYCLASNASGGADTVLVASSCKARDVEAASIRLWNAEEGKCVQVLSGGHKSTVATLSFSTDGQYLASSGKDRRLCIWRRDQSDPQTYSLVCAKDSAHKRIIWSVDFCPCTSGKIIFASGSRDGCVKIWTVDGTGPVVNVTELHSFAPSFIFQNGKPDSVTALAFTTFSSSLKLTGAGEETAILGLGLESGRIELWEVPPTGVKLPQLLARTEESQCHNAAVTRLAWRPKQNGRQKQLASCSMDYGCRIHEFLFEK